MTRLSVEKVNIDGRLALPIAPNSRSKKAPNSRSTRQASAFGRHLSPLRLAGIVLLTLYAGLSIYPFAWMVSGAFKDKREVVASGSLIPRHGTFETLQQTWMQLDFARYFTNSAILTVGSLVIILVIYPLAGYAFSVLRFPGRRVILGLFVAVLFVPGVTTLLPLILITQKLHLLGSYTGLGLAFANGAGPLAIIIFKTFYDGLPSELHDAALIDGAGELRIHFAVYLPLARPAVATVAVLNFVAIWNEYIVSGVSLTDSNKFTLPLGLQGLLSSNVVHWNEVMAGALLLVLPIIVVFIFLQKYFVSAIQGAVKG